MYLGWGLAGSREMGASELSPPLIDSGPIAGAPLLGLFLLLGLPGTFLVPVAHPFQGTEASFKLCCYDNGHDVKQSHCLDVLRGKGGWALCSLWFEGCPGEQQDHCNWFVSERSLCLRCCQHCGGVGAAGGARKCGLNQRQALGVGLG